MSPARLLNRLLAVALLAVPCAGLVAGPAAAQVDRPPGLTPYQERAVLQLIDDICGDTWCEGDFAFDFRRFSCVPETQTCTLRLRIAPYTDGPRDWQVRSGQVRGFVRYRQMVHTSASGTLSLQPKFSSAVNALIGRVEASVDAP